MALLKLLLSWLGSLLGGPFAEAALRAYAVKKQAETSEDAQIAATLAKQIEAENRLEELRAQLLIAEQGSWMTRAIRPLLALPVVILLFKLLVWDIALGQWTNGTTDQLSPQLWSVVNTIVVAYMGGRTIEKTAPIIASIFRR